MSNQGMYCDRCGTLNDTGWCPHCDRGEPYLPPMTEYDTAIHALAPYLPDGWVAQGQGGMFTIHEDKPNLFEPEGARYGYWRAVTWRIEHPLVNVPACPDWRTSLRRIQGGKVVEADPTEETKGGGE